MKTLKSLALALFSFLMLVSIGKGDPSWSLKFDTQMVRSTVRIIYGNSTGTGFVICQSVSSNACSYVLVTAAHVLSGAQDSNATLLVRVKKDMVLKKVAHTIQVRANNTNLWVKHPTADVAAMRIKLPSDTDIDPIPSNLLYSDADIESLQLHPGDELRVLGYPLGMEANEYGFPILRSGRVASFPLTPAKQIKSFLLDFRVFPGNSGGPVYILTDRQFEQGSLNTVSYKGIVGLISEEAQYKETINTFPKQ